MKLGIGVDIGASRLRVALGTKDGRILKKMIEKTSFKSKTSLVDQVERMIGEIIGDREFGEIEGIGMGVVGPLDIHRGVISPANSPVKEIDLLNPLADRLETRMSMVNDCIAATIGVRSYGCGRGVENLVYLTFSTGIGAGVIVDGHVLIGKGGNAHEVGHMVVDPEMKLVCGCGGRGHWEAYCSGANLPNYVRLLVEENEWEFEESLMYGMSGGWNGLKSEFIFDAARKGDWVAKEVLKRVNRFNRIGMANVINLYDPSLVVVGGAMALNNWNLLVEPMIDGIEKMLVTGKPRFEMTMLGDDVVLYGALELAFNPMGAIRSP